MKIVVDISRKCYEDFKLQLPILNKKAPSEVAKYSIATGIPLSEGYNEALFVLEDIKAEIEKEIIRGDNIDYINGLGMALMIINEKLIGKVKG